MRFKIDENLPAEAAAVLSQRGHNAETALAEGLGGSSDADVSRACINEARALVTLDTDFADVRSHPPEESPGIIVLRLKRQDKPAVLQVLARIAVLLETEPLHGLLWIVEEDQVRIRPQA